MASNRIERRITLLFIAAGGIFAFIGTILGALMLARMSGVTIPFSLVLFQDHPYLQIFGFLAEFIFGVSYSTIPLFKSTKLPNPRASYATFSFITIANIISIFAMVSSEGYYISLFEVSSFLILLSSVIFCYQFLRLLGRPSKILAEAQPFFSMAAVSFLLISVVFFLDFAKPELLVNGADLFSVDFIYLSLAGFAGCMLFGVELRTVAFRRTNYRKRAAKIAIGFIGSAITAYAVVLLPGVISQKAPKKHLSLLPLLFLNAGLLLRIFGNFYSTLSAGSLPVLDPCPVH